MNVDIKNACVHSRCPVCSIRIFATVFVVKTMNFVAKSFGKTTALTGLINFGFNLYENNWQIDGAMLLDTAIDTAIGLGAYGLAAGTTSLVLGGLAMAGVAIPGIVVVGGIILLSIGFEWLIREITGYKN